MLNMVKCTVILQSMWMCQKLECLFGKYQITEPTFYKKTYYNYRLIINSHVVEILLKHHNGVQNRNFCQEIFVLVEIRNFIQKSQLCSTICAQKFVINNKKPHFAKIHQRRMSHPIET